MTQCTLKIVNRRSLILFFSLTPYIRLKSQSYTYHKYAYAPTDEGNSPGTFARISLCLNLLDVLASRHARILTRGEKRWLHRRNEDRDLDIEMLEKRNVHWDMRITS
jgi:hypothetical protein